MLAAGAGHLEAPPLPFTLLQHSLQCAAVLAEEHPGDRELHAAGLLHDIGHTLLPGRPDRHGEVAGAYLRPLLGNRLAELVRLHVDAKRYLVAVEPDYAETLTMGSAETLVAQGAAMCEDEVAAFAAVPFGVEALLLRRADEAAKVPHRAVRGLEHWAPLLGELADAQRRSVAAR